MPTEIQSMNNTIKLVEVAARDGLQNEAKLLTPDQRMTFIKKLAEAGLKWIEAGSFVHPKAVPKMAGTDEIADYFHHYPIDADLSYLVPNEKGLELAKMHHVKHIAIFVAASEAFSMANIRMSVDESFERISWVVKEALVSGIKVRGYLSTIFQGIDGEEIDPKYVAELSARLLAMGCYEISLGDTTGVGTPETTAVLIKSLVEEGIPIEKVAMHYHDTFGRAIENIDKAYDLGIRIFDASTSGIGGCPYAKSATGNVDMLKVIEWALSKGLDMSAINLDSLAIASQYVQEQLK